MDNLLQHFAQWEMPSLSSFLESLPEEEFIKDWSQYVYVDGEEGDYGVVPISTQDGLHICTYINRGGDDDEEHEFTEAGKAYFKAKLRAAVLQWLERAE